MLWDWDRIVNTPNRSVEEMRSLFTSELGEGLNDAWQAAGRSGAPKLGLSHVYVGNVAAGRSVRVAGWLEGVSGLAHEVYDVDGVVEFFADSYSHLGYDSGAGQISVLWRFPQWENQCLWSRPQVWNFNFSYALWLAGRLWSPSGGEPWVELKYEPPGVKLGKDVSVDTKFGGPWGKLVSDPVSSHVNFFRGVTAGLVGSPVRRDDRVLVAAVRVLRKFVESGGVPVPEIVLLFPPEVVTWLVAEFPQVAEQMAVYQGVNPMMLRRVCSEVASRAVPFSEAAALIL